MSAIRPIAPVGPEASDTPVVLALPAALSDGVRERFTAQCPAHSVQVAPSVAAAARLADGRAVSLVIAHLDAEPAGVSVQSLVESGAGRFRVIVLGTEEQTRRGLALLDRGAVDFLEWPRESRRLALLVDLLSCRRNPPPPAAAAPLVGTAGSDVEHLLRQVDRVAGVPTSVLFQGETGTGKTVLARHLHARSGRTGPLVEVNCAALPEGLFESELFGHVKGAFTGATRDRTGRLAAAADGTLFLDEVDALSLTSQAKLLRVVESGLYEPVGSDDTRAVKNVRFVAASNRPRCRSGGGHRKERSSPST
jgi:DNA-binding NtrC family response regulator